MSKFVGNADVRLLPNGREIELLSHFEYVDDYGRVWRAPKGSIVDGASIPRLFWRFIGCPLVGKYRRASIIHDVYCKNKDRPYQLVHLAWCEMVQVDGCDDLLAKIICFAVKTFGPRW